MRRNLFWGIAALALFSFSACQKEVEVPIVDDSGLVTVTLTADRACDETRAAAVEGTDGVTYIWTEADKANFKLFSVTTEDVQQNGETVQKEVLTEIENPVLSLSSDNKVLTVTARVEPGAKVRAVVASEWTTSDAKSPKPRLPMTQNSLEGNMDPSSDILVADDLTVDENTEGKLVFHRPVTVNKMTLKGLNSAEKVEKIVLISEKYLTGYYNYSTGAMSGQQKELTVKYVSGTVNSTELFPIYFVTMPNAGHTLTLVVETIRDSKKYRYTKTFGPVNFTKGKFSIFSVNLKDLGEEVSTVDYSGEWVIGGTQSGNCMAATKYVYGSSYPATEVSIEGDVVTVPGSKESYKMTVTLITKGENVGRYTIQDAGGKYLAATGGTTSNQLKGQTEPSYWIISKNVDGTYDVLADILSDEGRKSMRVNWNNGNPLVSCYRINSGQPKVVLYPYEKVVETAVSSPVTFSQPSVAGCSIAVSVDGSPITSGTNVAQGRTVTLTATVGTGCTFGGWTVTGATVADAAASTTTFKMGDSAVAVSATFSSSTDNRTYTITWNATNNSKKVSGYTDTWSVTADGFTCNMANWNNNNNNWNYVKAGRKDNASVATITTAAAVPEKIKTVTLTIDAVTASKINSLKLYVGSSSSFSGASSYSFNVATGSQSVTIPSPAANRFYKIEANCAAGSSNGLITVSKLVFSTE